MPELGKYAFFVLASYGASLALLGGLVGLSIRRNAKMRAALQEAEARRT